MTNAADYPSLQAAILDTAAGGIVNLGNHTLTGVVTIPRPMTLSGGSITPNGGGLRAGADNVTLDGITITGTNALLFSSATANYTGWTFRNCNFDGVSLRLTKLGRTQTDGSTAATGTGVTDNSVIEQCSLTNYGANYTIEIGGCQGVAIRECHIYDTGLDTTAGDGIKLLAGTTGTHVVDCVIEDCTRDGIDTYDSATATIENCEINRCHLGADIKKIADDANDTSGHIMRVCVLLDCTAGGINADADTLVIENNTVTNCGEWGLRIAGTGTVATGNTMQGHVNDLRISATAQDLNTDVLTANTYTTLGDAR